MRGFEREIEEAAYKRSAPVQKPELALLRRVEDFAINNMSGLAMGCAGAVVGLAVMLSVSNPVPAHLTKHDPVIVGSISSPARVPKVQDWRTVRKPVEIMALQAPQFDRVPTVYSARSNTQGDREDTLLWQTASQHLPEARISMVRRSNGGTAQSLFIEMTRQQAERGLSVVRAGMPGPMQTKFGVFEVSDMIFSDDAEREQACLAFRSSADKTTIALSGWFCAPKGAAAERPEVACFIDRLSLLKSGDDKDLRRFFTEAEQRRKGCPTSRISTGRKPTWLDVDGKAPSMREDTTGSIGGQRKK
ncbi:MAG: hypothetical protein ACRCWF_18375 [Beijerinckiaceae bacterium]